MYYLYIYIYYFNIQPIVDNIVVSSTSEDEIRSRTGRCMYTQVRGKRYARASLRWDTERAHTHTYTYIHRNIHLYNLLWTYNLVEFNRSRGIVLYIYILYSKVYDGI